jgi:hypothetical protein
MSTPRTRAPALLVGVDTEADDQWSARGRAELSVRNAGRLPAFQAACDALGVRPSYLLTHEMASREESAAVLRALLAEGRCEVGAHLHPWSSPPYRAEDRDGHRYPHQLPDDLLRRQLTELTALIETGLGRRPTTYRAGRHGFDERSLRILEELGYTVDTSVDPLFNERHKGGAIFAGAPLAPYHPDYADVRRPGRARLLEVPVSAATTPALPKPLEKAFASLTPIPWRGAFKRVGLRAVWLRPSYSALPDMLAFASRLAARGLPCFNVLFHSSELLPGGSPYTPDAASAARFLEDLQRLFEHLTTRLGAVGRTYAEFAQDFSAQERAAASVAASA